MYIHTHHTYICLQADTAVTKAWLGPRGTVTPIHHDPDHNIFTQVCHVCVSCKCNLYCSV
jgi:hypothetical protein